MEVTERFCSYEVAMLLKKKGFDAKGVSEYGGVYETDLKGKVLGYSLQPRISNEDTDLLQCLRPTQQMACDWIFKKCKRHISLEYDNCIGCWECHIRRVDKPDSYFIFTGIKDKEKAINTAMWYVLNNYEPK